MTDKYLAECDHAKLARLLKSGELRLATDGDHSAFGEPLRPKPSTDQTNLGMPLAEAIWQFATDQSDRRRFLLLNARAHIRSGAVEELLTLEEANDYEALKVFLEDDLIRKLVRSDLTAHWHPPGSTMLEDIPATWWIGARVDSRTSTAFSNGTHVPRMLIRRAVQANAVAPTDSTVVRKRAPPVVESWTVSQVEDWFRGRVSEFASRSRHPSELDDVEAARKAFPGIKRDLIRSFRTRFVPAERRKQGRS